MNSFVPKLTTKQFVSLVYVNSQQFTGGNSSAPACWIQRQNNEGANNRMPNTGETEAADDLKHVANDNINSVRLVWLTWYSSLAALVSLLFFLDSFPLLCKG